MDSLSIHIVWALNKVREDRGIPVAELARRAGMREIALGTSLRGKRKLTVGELRQLCSVLDLTFDDLDTLIKNADRSNPELQYLFSSRSTCNH